MIKFHRGTSTQRSADAAAAAGAADTRAAAADAAWVGVSRRTIASYEEYAHAERAVNRLADNDFPVDRTTIVGVQPTIVERVTGRLTPAVAAGRSALTGALIGALFGWLLGIFGMVDPIVTGLWLALNGAILGAVLGAVLGLIGYAVTRGRRSFTGVGAIRAQRYEVQTDADVADEAARLLQASAEPRADRSTDSGADRNPDSSTEVAS